MKVAFVPVWRRNPYHLELTNALHSHGIEVIWPESLKALSADFVASNEQPDILHIHAFPICRLSPRVLARFLLFYFRVVRLHARGVRIVWTVHNLHNHDSSLWWLEERFSCLFMRWFSSLIVHGPTAKHIIEKRWRCPGTHIAVIPHGHYIQSYRNERSAAEARNALRLEPSDLVFLFLGQLRPYKGMVEMVTAFKACLHPEVRLLIAGRPANAAIQGEMANAVQDDARIRFIPGLVEDDDVQTYMNASDLVVFPYQRVFSSGAVILAMSFGRPCLAARVGGVNDALDEGGAIFFDPAVSGDLHRAFRDVIASREQLPEMGAYNRRRAAQWDWDKIGLTTAELYEQCLEAK